MKGQHAGLSPERWTTFTFDQQVLMIANEMNRASKLQESSDRDLLRTCYERVLALVDLTVGVQKRESRRRELLRWRDLIAAMLISDTPEPLAHAAAFRCLLRFTPAASAQIPLILPS
jgi:hypothetical protein